LMSNGYDIIGDIHGHADELKELLEELEYCCADGCYRHANRQVIFLGDFIDRGPKQREVLQIVIPMVQHEAALAVMGNHEFNALAFHTKDPNHPYDWLRPHSDKNINQHQRFLEEYDSHEADLTEVLKFFQSLPLWLDLAGLRVVHACWESKFVQALGGDNLLSPARLIEANRKGTPVYKAIEALLKGVEYTLPNDLTFTDKDGNVRDAARTRWWKNENGQLGDAVFPPGAVDETSGKLPVSANDLVGYPESEKPVFIGHYWLKGKPTLMAPNVACLDYSVAKGGTLTAYRWSGEQVLSDDKFVVAK
jgi:hypothetical protein